ncbi:MAG TPA: NAD(P)-binding domain-containing protein, partial [Stellaceae bacterium]|nr:NAD(P)-binding domain-containing protein [Stellaceae bacterium]
MSNKIVIIGAGPYGLSIAAHLRARGVGFRIFGQPMANWQHKMPRGMLLKSDGFASNLADPEDRFSLEAFCAEQGQPYASEGLPIPRETFIAYGEAFQQRFVPEVERREVIALRRSGRGFAVQLDDGELVAADKVVIGVGISDFGYVPRSLAELPAEFVTHSSRYADLAGFRGRSVAVIGGGSSAVDIAALLQEEGADVQLVTRRPRLRFHGRPEENRPLAARLRAPNTGIGPGWPSVLYTQAPRLFHRLSAETRMRIVSTSHGPAGGWYMQDRILERVPHLSGYETQSAIIRGGQVHLRLVRPGGSLRVASVDHVIAATGYRIDVRKVGFLDA